MSASDKKIPFFWGWMTLIIGAILASLSIWLVDPPKTEQTATALPWEATINEQGKLTVLGLTLGQSTTRDAMALYGKEVQTSLFADQAGKAISLESFFEDMYIGYTLRGRLILTLDVEPTTLEAIMTRGARIKSTESGARDVSLAANDTATALDYPIRALTYIPYPKLDEAALKSRFGEPAEDKIGSDGLRRWFYPTKQLIIIFDDSGRKTLQFGEQHAP